MLELGADAPGLHAGLAAAVTEAGTDLVFAAGPNMKHLFDALPEAKRAGWGPDSKSIEHAVVGTVRPGDAVMIKGSNGSRMGVLVEALRRRYSGASVPG
jgi:UDP-N-acetylmuramoyl-tripeptide--D-alanyl-D-alanine ligase